MKLIKKNKQQTKIKKTPPLNPINNNKENPNQKKTKQPNKTKQPKFKTNKQNKDRQTPHQWKPKTPLN